jgi:hypothetical protein
MTVQGFMVWNEERHRKNEHSENACDSPIYSSFTTAATTASRLAATNDNCWNHQRKVEKDPRPSKYQAKTRIALLSERCYTYQDDEDYQRHVWCKGEDVGYDSSATLTLARFSRLVRDGFMRLCSSLASSAPTATSSWNHRLPEPSIVSPASAFKSILVLPLWYSKCRPRLVKCFGGRGRGGTFWGLGSPKSPYRAESGVGLGKALRESEGREEGVDACTRIRKRTMKREHTAQEGRWLSCEMSTREA